MFAPAALLGLVVARQNVENPNDLSLAVRILIPVLALLVVAVFLFSRRLLLVERAKLTGRCLRWSLAAALQLPLLFVLAWLIGANGSDALAVGQLLGVKLFLGEFLAYIQLSEMSGQISEKSFAIATFALCGFGNFVAVGIQIGGIGTLVESRKDDLARIGLKAMLGGSLVTMMTATIAGVLL